jgi:uncharacterized membrane protein YwzB
MDAPILTIIRRAAFGGILSIEIEQFVEDSSSFLFAVLVVIVSVVIASLTVVSTFTLGWLGWITSRFSLTDGHPLNDFIQFATVEPDAPTVGTVIDLDTLTIGDN